MVGLVDVGAGVGVVVSGWCRWAGTILSMCSIQTTNELCDLEFPSFVSFV